MAEIENHEQGVLKSLQSNLVAFVTFTSRIRRPIELLWMNFQGKAVKYATMYYNDVYHVDTFVSHPWVIWDSDTHERLLLNQNPVFRPSPFDPNMPVQAVTIDLPVYSLRECCLQAVRRYFEREKIKDLELPRTLLYDLLNPPSPGIDYPPAEQANQE